MPADSREVGFGGRIRANRIPVFCKEHNISTSYYYELKKKGLTPREIKLGRIKLISDEAAAEWRREMERRSIETAKGSPKDGAVNGDPPKHERHRTCAPDPGQSETTDEPEPSDHGPVKAA